MITFKLCVEVLAVKQVIALTRARVFRMSIEQIQRENQIMSWANSKHTPSFKRPTLKHNWEI